MLDLVPVTCFLSPRPVIAFHWLDSACQSVPTLYFDCVLDTFFLFDIIFSFNLGVIYQGQYYDDKKCVCESVFVCMRVVVLA